MNRFWRLGHRWLGVLAALVIVVTALTGWLLMHPSWLAGQDLRHVAADPKDARHLLAGGPQGLYRSLDGGRSWALVPMLVPTEDVVALTSGSGGFAVAFREMGLWRSSDGYIWDAVATSDGERIGALSFSGDRLVVLSDRSLQVADAGIPLTPSWQRRLHDWHTGWALGATGARLVEAGALAMLLLTLSGIVIFARSLRRRRTVYTMMPAESDARQPQP